jgi:hypothetical protein
MAAAKNKRNGGGNGGGGWRNGRNENNQSAGGVSRIISVMKWHQKAKAAWRPISAINGEINESNEKPLSGRQ